MKSLLSLTDILLIWLISLILFCFLAYRFGYSNGEEEQKADQVKVEQRYKDTEIALRKEHASKISKLLESQYQTNLKNTYDHEIALKKKDAELRVARADVDRRGGLQITVPAVACKTGDVGTGTQATSTGERDEGTTTTLKLPDRVEDGLWNLVSRADEVTEQLRACQGWIYANGFYGEKPLTPSP